MTLDAGEEELRLEARQKDRVDFAGGIEVESKEAHYVEPGQEGEQP